MTKTIYLTYYYYNRTSSLPFPESEDGDYEIHLFCRNNKWVREPNSFEWRRYPVKVIFKTEEDMTKWLMRKDEPMQFFDTCDEAIAFDDTQTGHLVSDL